MKLSKAEGYEVLFGVFEAAVWLFLWITVVSAVLAPLATALGPAPVQAVAGVVAA